MKTDLLDAQLVWQTNGHVSDLVVSMLADDQGSMLPPAAIAHVDACSFCVDRMVNMALLSLEVAAALDTMPLLEKRAFDLVPAVYTQSSRVPRGHDFPRHFFLVALALALIGALPTLEASRKIAGFLVLSGPDLLTLIQGVRLASDFLAQAMGNGLLLASFLASFACVTAGWFVAKRWPTGSLEGNLG